MPDDSGPSSTYPRGYSGLERRRVDRPPSPYRVIGRARVSSQHALRYEGLRWGRWYAVVAPPVGQLAAPLPGHIRLDDCGRTRQVVAALFDVELLPTKDTP